MADTKVTLKLLIDNKANKVLFAEAGKNFIDFLFNLMSMPVGTVTRLLTKKSMVGSIGNLYDSIENISDTYLQTNLSKECLLKPKSPVSALNVSLLLPTGDTTPTSTSKKLYQCHQINSYAACRSNVTDDPNRTCTHCGNYMNKEMNYMSKANVVSSAAAGSGGGGFVKGVVTYMVMDNLVVSPMSTISSITLLNKFGVKGIDSLEERMVDLDMDQGLKLLKESLQSTTVLTSVFLKK